MAMNCLISGPKRERSHLLRSQTVPWVGCLMDRLRWVLVGLLVALIVVAIVELFRGALPF